MRNRIQWLAGKLCRDCAITATCNKTAMKLANPDWYSLKNQVFTNFLLNGVKNLGLGFELHHFHLLVIPGILARHEVARHLTTAIVICIAERHVVHVMMNKTIPFIES